MTHGSPHPIKIVMAGLDPATQCARVRARGRLATNINDTPNSTESLRLADARRLGGRVKPGHDEVGEPRRGNR